MRPAKYFLFWLLIQQPTKRFNAAVTLRVNTHQLGPQRIRQKPPICAPPKTIGEPIQKKFDQDTEQEAEEGAVNLTKAGRS